MNDTVPAKAMEFLEVRSRREWREWLQTHYASRSSVWLVFRKRDPKPSITYDGAVEEALCFGWIDSIIRRLDESRYARKFTPRKLHSRWSTINRRRYARLVSQGLITGPGRARAPTNRGGDAPRRTASMPRYIAKRLKGNQRAWRHFKRLAPSYRQAYVAWIDAAKQAQTRKRRLREALTLLAEGKKLGLR